MKNLSLILNGVLAIAVGILFYQVHNLKNPAPAENEKTETEQATKAPELVTGPTNLTDAKIAYVDIDSINNNYAMIADFTKVLRNKRAALEAQMQSMTAKFQQDYEEFQRSAQAGILPQAELQKKQQELERQQQELANKELQMQNLGVEMEDKNAELNTTVKEYLKRYNNSRFDYILSYSDMVPTILLTNSKLDITGDVLKGLNEEYKAKNTKNKK